MHVVILASISASVFLLHIFVLPFWCCKFHEQAHKLTLWELVYDICT